MGKIEEAINNPGGERPIIPEKVAQMEDMKEKVGDKVTNLNERLNAADIVAKENKDAAASQSAENLKKELDKIAQEFKGATS